jgi:hypothetical protein
MKRLAEHRVLLCERWLVPHMMSLGMPVLLVVQTCHAPIMIIIVDIMHQP